MKYQSFLSENCLEVKFSLHLNRCLFVMNKVICLHTTEYVSFRETFSTDAGKLPDRL